MTLTLPALLANLRRAAWDAVSSDLLATRASARSASVMPSAASSVWTTAAMASSRVTSLATISSARASSTAAVA